MTTASMAAILVKTGLIDPQAIDDPAGFDNCVTAGKVAEAVILIESEQETKLCNLEAEAAAMRQVMHDTRRFARMQPADGDYFWPKLDAAIEGTAGRELLAEFERLKQLVESRGDGEQEEPKRETRNEP